MPRPVQGGSGRIGVTGRGLPIEPNLIARAIRFALNQRGTPYLWGGTTTAGFDCSGLVYAAYRRAGYEGIGRTTYDQIKQGVPVGLNHLRPGDIVFPEPGHEGLYIGNGRVLEAPHTGDVVKVVPLSQFGFWQARRLIGGGGGIVPPRVGIGGLSQNGLPVPHPSIDPQMFAQWQRQQAQEMAKFQTQFQQTLAQQNKQQLQQMTRNAAQARQQALAQQVQQQQTDRVSAAQAAQRTLSGGLSGGGYAAATPVTDYAVRSKDRTDQLRQEALRRAGLG